MAEEKKEPFHGIFDPHPDPFVHFVWMTLVILVILYLINGFLRMFVSTFTETGGFGGIMRLIILFIISFILGWPFKIVSLTVIFLSVFLLIRFLRKLFILRAIDRQNMYPEPPSPAAVRSPEWERIQSHLQSPNENDWRTAILEADIMLNAILEKLALPGETMGDKLKAVDKSTFLTLDNAWEAHNVRNRIAHEGQNFVLTGREAKRVIDLYRKVFEEFQII